MSNKFAAIAVAMLLILTAWGNATVMLFAAVFGLVVFVLISRKNITWGAALVLFVGIFVSIGIVLVMMLL